MRPSALNCQHYITVDAAVGLELPALMRQWRVVALLAIEPHQRSGHFSARLALDGMCEQSAHGAVFEHRQNQLRVELAANVAIL